MKFDMLYSKIHRARVMDANLNYVGSITIDEELIEAAKIRAGQKVEILDVNNGERFSTYVIKGERGSGALCINGAAARKVAVGDVIIVIAYAQYDESELESYRPNVVLVDSNNAILEIKHEV